MLECLKTPFLHLFNISEKKQEEFVVRISLGQESFLEASDTVVKLSLKFRSRIRNANRNCSRCTETSSGQY